MNNFFEVPRELGSALHDEGAHRRAAYRAVAFSAAGLALTGGIELAAALFTGSVALLGDSLHNLADVSTSAVVFFGFLVSRKNPTRSYPYGYERAEDLAGLGVALVVWLSAGFAGYQSYEKLISGTGTSHLGAGMLAAVVGIVGNFAVSQYKFLIGRRIQSLTLQADANHSWLDMISSAGALIGLIGVGLGYRWADPVAGFAVTLFICHVGYEVTRDMVHHLMDGVEPEHIDAAERAIHEVPGIVSATVRGRWMGRTLLIEVEGTMASPTTLGQASVTGRRVEDVVRRALPEARRVQWIPRSDGTD